MVQESSLEPGYVRIYLFLRIQIEPCDFYPHREDSSSGILGEKLLSPGAFLTKKPCHAFQELFDFKDKCPWRAAFGAKERIQLLSGLVL